MPRVSRWPHTGNTFVGLFLAYIMAVICKRVVRTGTMIARAQSAVPWRTPPTTTVRNNSRAFSFRNTPPSPPHLVENCCKPPSSFLRTTDNLGGCMSSTSFGIVKRVFSTPVSTTTRSLLQQRKNYSTYVSSTANAIMSGNSRSKSCPF